MSKQLEDLTTLDDFMVEYGAAYARETLRRLDPLHVPGRDALPDFSACTRQPLEGQAHAVAALVKVMDEYGSGGLSATPGAGKTIMGTLAVHSHAARPLAQGGHNGKYRCIVLCPDHLISKWKEEIEETIPGARVTTLAKWGDIIGYWGSLRSHDPSSAKWRPRVGPEFLVLGRDQVKRAPRWVPAGNESTKRIFDRKARTDVEVQTFTCPECGQPVQDAKGNMVGEMRKQVSCNAVAIREVPHPEKTGQGLDFIALDDHRNEPTDKAMTGTISRDWRGRVEFHPDPTSTKQYKLARCGCQLWSYARTKGYECWPIARFIHQKMKRGAFQYLIADEVHELKEEGTAQSMGFSKLMSVVDHTIVLTGTLLGGYADHVFPTLFRMDPKPMLAEGLAWGKPLEFVRRYGCVDEVLISSESDVAVGRSTASMRRTRERKEYRRAPGIMPSLYANHLLGRMVFVDLNDLSSDLPPLHDNAPIAVTMEPELAAAYEDVRDALATKVKEMLSQSHGADRRLLSTYLHTTLAYPDRPWGWGAVGYHEGETFIPVVHPRNLNCDDPLAKEQELLNLVQGYAGDGQVWIYCELTDKFDIQDRIKGLIEGLGLRTSVLRRNTVSRQKRMDWIRKNGPKNDVIISHPQLVETGLDFIKKGKDGYNYRHIIFYEIGYNVFRVAQASRRAYRIIQDKPCTIDYLFTSNTAQAQAMALVAKKRRASAAIDGDLSADGLMAMAGAGDVSLDLARMIEGRIDTRDIARGWARNGASVLRGGDSVIPMPRPAYPADEEDVMASVARLRARLAAMEEDGGQVSMAVSTRPYGEPPRVTAGIESLAARLARICSTRGAV